MHPLQFDFFFLSLYLPHLLASPPRPHQHHLNGTPLPRLAGVYSLILILVSIRQARGAPRGALIRSPSVDGGGGGGGGKVMTLVRAV